MFDYSQYAIFLPPKNGELRFSDQKILSNKEEKECRKSIREAVYTENIENNEVRCCYCKIILNPDQMTLEHKFPQCFGGSYIKANLAPCCKKCNNDRSINFTHEGNIINIGHFKCPPLKTSIMQEKLSTLVVIRFYSMMRNVPMESVRLDEALCFFYKGVMEEEEMLLKMPRSYRTHFTTNFVPLYKKAWWKIKVVLDKLNYFKGY